MHLLHRSAFAAVMVTVLARVPVARAADPAPADRPAETARRYTATREAFPMTTLAPSFQFDGTWRFDAARSDDPVKVMQAARPRAGAGSGPRMFGGMDGGGRREGGMRPGVEEDDGGDHPDQPAENRPRGIPPMARVMRPAARLSIAMQADQVVVTEDGNPPRPYALADSLRAHDHELLTENTSARWKAGGLELTQALGPRGRLVECYELSHDGRTLTIRARREGGREGVRDQTLTRVYTRDDGR